MDDLHLGQVCSRDLGSNWPSYILMSDVSPWHMEEFCKTFTHCNLLLKVSTRKGISVLQFLHICILFLSETQRTKIKMWINWKGNQTKKDVIFLSCPCFVLNYHRFCGRSIILIWSRQLKDVKQYEKADYPRFILHHQLSQYKQDECQISRIY